MPTKVESHQPEMPESAAACTSSPRPLVQYRFLGQDVIAHHIVEQRCTEMKLHEAGGHRLDAPHSLPSHVHANQENPLYAGGPEKAGWIDTAYATDTIGRCHVGGCVPLGASDENYDEEIHCRKHVPMDAGGVDAVGDFRHVFDLRTWS